jgi:N-acetyl sugar amidotransferase
MKILFLSTTSFPFGHAEPLLFDKINNLKEFDKIYILQPLPINSELKCILPQNAEVIYLTNKLTFFQKLLGLVRILSFNVRNEIKYSKKRDVKFSLKHLKVLLNSLSLARVNMKVINLILDQYAAGFTSFYFYSYWCTESTIAASLLKQNGAPISVFTRMHAYDLYEERHVPNYLPLRELIIRQADKIFFVSDQGRDYFINLHSQLSNFFIQKYYVNRLGVYKNDKNVLSTLNDKIENFTIVSCSSLIPLKRIHLMIEAFSLIKKYKINWIHFGDGYLYNDIKKLADNRLKESSVVLDLKGFIINDKIKKFYAENSVDLFLNTSQYEGVPISMMEAMAYGIPCIGTDVGGVSEIINSSNGYLLNLDFNPIELATIIENHFNTEQHIVEKLRTSAFDTWNQKFNGENNLVELKSVLFENFQECNVCLFNNKVYKNIIFDENGVCNVCKANEELKKNSIFDKEIKNKKLNDLLTNIKNDRSGKYNCLIGLSGGVDSSYVAYKAKEWGLNPLILHVDNGWNSELASMNIEKIITKLEFDLYTYVINWSEMKDIQLSFFKSSVVDIDLPMDNAIMAIQFNIAKKFGIKYILSGINTSTEGWMPTDFSHYKLDSMNVRSIHNKYGKTKLKSFPLVSPLQFLWYTRLNKIKFCAPLDFIDYNKQEAKTRLINEFGWRDYGGKHYENIFTKFYQGVILPEKFSFDKRMSHLSALIISKQITKKEAIKEFATPVYDMKHYDEDRDFFIKKLEISLEEYNEVMSQKPESHTKFKSYVNIINKMIKLKKRIQNFI